ncbi:MAG: winged helix-turn-helix domain-containing protein [Microbacteriaceae bacterium]
MTVLSPFPAAASAHGPTEWYFGDFVLDLPRYELRHHGISVRVEPQVFDVLTQLVKYHHRVVTKTELFDAVWGGRFVGEAALSSRIKAVRRALGDNGEAQQYIRTVRGRGYQFVGALIDPEAGCAERATDADGLGSAVVLTRGIVAGADGVLHFRPRRSRGHSRARYRVAPSMRRREFNGPPK